MDDLTFLQKFQRTEIPAADWHHREHIKAAYLYLRRYPFDQALTHMRAGVQALNATQNVPETLTRGYHETITQAWMRLVDLILAEYGPAKNADTFYEEHPELSQSKALRLFYSRKRLTSAKAKAEFVQPDLARLPKPRRKAPEPNRKNGVKKLGQKISRAAPNRRKNHQGTDPRIES
jgi:hypothetical protein